jgi:hypothetical protein
MSVAEIKKAVESVSKLPPKERSEVSAWIIKTVQPETFGAKLRNAFACGTLDKLIKEAEADYSDGKALDRIY